MSAAEKNIPDVLKKIIVVKKEEVAALHRSGRVENLRAAAKDAGPRRGFFSALKRRAVKGRVGLIAEVKKASPSKGIIRADFDPLWIAERYAEGGADCLSVLTDEQFFQGRLEFLKAIRGVVSLPLLRKDFMIDAAQLYESLDAGADAILLIAACLAPSQLKDLHDEATSIGLDVLVEIHDEAEWDGIRASGLNPPLVGVNNRDLRSFDVSLDITARLAPAVLESGAFLVAESGIFTPADVATLKSHGASAILVGESLMKQRDPGIAARELLS
ncbi:indole-3-glycerol phosphate synthase TrpC [soil metagenome]